MQGDTKSAWSDIACEMREDEKTRAMQLPDRMNRRKCVEQEHRFRRGVYDPNEIQHPFAVTQKDLDKNSDTCQFPWAQENRDKEQHLHKKMIS